MKQETYKPSRLFWFSALLLTLSTAILSVALNQLKHSSPSIQEASEVYDLEPSPEPPDPPPTSGPLEDYLSFVATAYSDRGTTASGVFVNTGIVAADPAVLPLGSVIELEVGTHRGIYTVLDTGAFIKGKRLDIYFPDYSQAIEFGRRAVRVKVLRHGWTIDPVLSAG